ncbi:hypothetical protein CSUI_008437 [Cystoisospora suis]|uniref:Uncharacterized protein n=1 Tax=Cystoisospora suis TaxID=483139 RepID=A0A2C6KKS3_9APIC|nr:hypothetical protein CSUI_008437 [Cystoisospora suis]
MTDSLSFPPELPGFFWDPEKKRYFPLASQKPPAVSAACPDSRNALRLLLSSSKSRQEARLCSLTAVAGRERLPPERYNSAQQGPGRERRGTCISPLHRGPQGKRMHSRKARRGYSRAVEGRESLRRMSYEGPREAKSNIESAHDSAEDGEHSIWNPCMDESKRKNAKDWVDTLKGQEEGRGKLGLRVNGERGRRKRRARSVTDEDSIWEEDNGEGDERVDLHSVKEGDRVNHLGTRVLTPQAGLPAAALSYSPCFKKARDGMSASVTHVESLPSVSPFFLSLAGGEENQLLFCYSTLLEEKTNNCFLLFRALRRGIPHWISRSSRLLTYTRTATLPFSSSRNSAGPAYQRSAVTSPTAGGKSQSCKGVVIRPKAQQAVSLQRRNTALQLRLPVESGWDEVMFLRFRCGQKKTAATTSYARKRSLSFCSPLLELSVSQRSSSSPSVFMMRASQLSSFPSSSLGHSCYSSIGTEKEEARPQITGVEIQERFWLHRMRHRLIVSPQQIHGLSAFLVSCTSSHPRVLHASSAVSEASSRCPGLMASSSPPASPNHTVHAEECPRQDILLHVSAGDTIESLQVVSPLFLDQLRTFGVRYHRGMISRLIEEKWKARVSSRRSTGLVSSLPSELMTTKNGQIRGADKAPFRRVSRSAVQAKCRVTANQRTADVQKEKDQQLFLCRKQEEKKIYQELTDTYFLEVEGLERKQRSMWERMLQSRPSEVRTAEGRGSLGRLAGLEIIGSFLICSHLGSCASGGCLRVFRTPAWWLPGPKTRAAQRGVSHPVYTRENGTVGEPSWLSDVLEGAEGAHLYPAPTERVPTSASLRCGATSDDATRPVVSESDECNYGTKKRSPSLSARHLERRVRTRPNVARRSTLVGPPSPAVESSSNAEAVSTGGAGPVFSFREPPDARQANPQPGVSLPKTDSGRSVSSSPMRSDLSMASGSLMPGCVCPRPSGHSTRVGTNQGRESRPEGGPGPPVSTVSGSRACGLVAEARDLAADVWCSAASFSQGSLQEKDVCAFDIIVGGSDPLLQALRFTEGSSSLSTVWQWRGFSAQGRTAEEGVRAEPPTPRRRGGERRTTPACLAVAWGSPLQGFDQGRQVNSSSVMAGLRDGSVYLVDVRVKETQPGMQLLAAETEADSFVTFSSKSDFSVNGQFLAKESHWGKIRKGGPVSCIRVVTGTTAIVARGSEELLLLDWREGTGGADTGAGHRERRNKVCVGRYLPTGCAPVPEAAHLPGSSLSPAQTRRQCVLDKHGQIVFSVCPCRGLLLFHRLDCPGAPVRTIDVHTEVMRLLSSRRGRGDDEAESEPLCSDQVHSAWCHNVLPEGLKVDETGFFTSLERHVPFELYGTCARVPTVPSFSLSGDGETGSRDAGSSQPENSFSSVSCWYAENQAASLLPDRSSGVRLRESLPGTGCTGWSCPAFVSPWGDSIPGCPMVNAEQSRLMRMGTPCGQSLGLPAVAVPCYSGSEASLPEYSLCGKLMQTQRSCSVVKPYCDTIPRCSVVEHSQHSPSVHMRTEVTRAAAPGGRRREQQSARVKLVASDSQLRSCHFDVLSNKVLRGSRSSETNSLPEAVLLYGEKRDLGDAGNVYGGRARAGGDVFLAVSSWGYHIVSCWGRDAGG